MALSTFFVALYLFFFFFFSLSFPYVFSFMYLHGCFHFWIVHQNSDQ